MRRALILWAGFAFLALTAGACGRFGSGSEDRKVAIVLQSDTDRHEGMARALHALLYAKELKETGSEVVLIFDGAGTRWVEKMQDPKNMLNRLYKSVEELGIVEVVCDHCAGAFKVKDKIKESGPPLVSEYEGHPSIAKWIEQGYRILIL